MDRLIRTAWRAFWVGLGASAVLVSQSVVSPPVAPAPVDPDVAPLRSPPPRPQASPAAARRPTARPTLSRSRIDPTTGRSGAATVLPPT